MSALVLHDSILAAKGINKAEVFNFLKSFFSCWSEHQAATKVPTPQVIHVIF